MTRASSYNIYVNLSDISDEMLVIHGYTGAHDVLSRSTAAFLQSQEAGPGPDPLYGKWSEDDSLGEAKTPSEETIQALRKRGYLTDKSIEEEHILFKKVAGRIHEHSRMLPPTYVIMPTYGCNLSCSYCFQSQLREDPNSITAKGFMQVEGVSRIVQAMTVLEEKCVIPKDQRPPRKITFFGGEPLFEKNRPAIENLMQRVSGMGPTDYSAITNATEIHAYEDLLGPGKIAQIQVTLDGPPDEHDRRRIYADGSGTFERIAQNLTMALERGVGVSVRMNIDKNNVKMLPALGEEILARGWEKYPNFYAYVAAIVAHNEQTDAKTTFNMWVLHKQLTELCAQYPSMRTINRFDEQLKGQILSVFNEPAAPRSNFRASFCGAHNGMHVFDAFGDIYACYEQAGDTKYRIGTVTKAGEVHMNETEEARWRSRDVTSNDTCSKCRYALFCGGGCAIQAMATNKKFFSNHCDGFQARFRSVAAEAYEDFVHGRKHHEVQAIGC